MAMPTCYVSGDIFDRAGEMVELAPGLLVS